MGSKFMLKNGPSLAMAIAFSLVFVAGHFVPLRAQVPGNELFAKEPQTPLELWDAVDYLLRTGQEKKALPYIEKFVKGKPDDATLEMIRMRYGPSSVLSLADHAGTRAYAEPLAEAMIAAARKFATDPKRLARFAAALTKSEDEQNYAVRRLREAGADAVPFVVEALARPGLSAEDRRMILKNAERLDRSAVPAFVAVLDSPDATLAADAATVLGALGDRRSIPDLTFAAASPKAAPEVRKAAQAAIERLTGRPFAAQERTPVEVLSDAAWRLHRHQADLGAEPVAVWTWDKERGLPVSKRVPRTEAEAILGNRFVKDALALSPTDRNARVVELSLNLEKAIERAGFTKFNPRDQAEFKAATAAGPSIVTEALKTAIADGKTDLAAVLATALGEVTEANALAATGRPHALVDALYRPGRRLQFAAAKAIVKLAPRAAFPGSGRVVPTLARFLPKQELGRAIVIDANPNRGSQLAGFLINLGYDSELEVTGARGFGAAAAAADVELILISHDLFGQQWTVNETLTNLKSDARTAAIPVFIYGPLNVAYEHPNLERNFPGIRFLVQPVDAAMLKKQMKELPNALDAVERGGYAREAADLIAGLAKQAGSPLAVDSTVAEQALAAALNSDETVAAAAAALSHVADPDAQRNLADVVLDPARPAAIRDKSAKELVESIRRFGPLMSALQEARLKTMIADEEDPIVLADLQAISRALRGVSTGDGSAKPPAPPVPATGSK